MAPRAVSSPIMSDRTILVTVEDLICQAMGPTNVKPSAHKSTSIYLCTSKYM